MLDFLQDEATQRAILPGLEQVAPGYADWIITTLFGGTYLREGLSLRDRQLINLAALTAVGGVDPQLAGHVKTGLRVGMTRQEVIEVFVHLAPYIAVPKALAGLRVAVAALANAEQENAQCGRRFGPCSGTFRPKILVPATPTTTCSSALPCCPGRTPKPRSPN